MDVTIVSSDTDEINIGVILRALEDANYYVASITVTDRRGRVAEQWTNEYEDEDQ